MSKRSSAGSEGAPGIGALRQWREELRRGLNGQQVDRPSTWKNDALYRAACCEANALAASNAGLPDTASLWFGRAADEIVNAIAERTA